MTAFSGLTRRQFGGVLLGAATVLPRPSPAANPANKPLHGLSAFGDLKYGPRFAQFDYATPDAPQGGRMILSVPNWTLNQSPDTFDTLNTFVLQGNAPPRMEKLYDALMTSSLDEPDAIYCALAESVTVSADGDRFTFVLRPQARFSTGAPVTADDVAFSYNTLKAEGHPSLAIALREIAAVVVSEVRTIEIRFTGRQTVQAALDALVVPVMQAAFFETREFTRTGMTPIPGSGAYAIGRFEPGRFIEYEKRPDYWAKDLPFARGLDHFQTLRIEFFRDRQSALQAFKKGDITCREEFTTKAWATEYDFPAVREGRVVRREWPDDKRGRFQCWALNQRRERFADVRVRRALNLCFDFEWTNANLLFGLRTHSDSPFEGSEFKASGPPSPAEMAVLEPLRDRLAPEIFGQPWVQPVSDGSGIDRKLLRQASELFAAAGWTRQGSALVDAAGETFRLEFLINDPEQERVYGKMLETMRRLGIDASFRLVDAAQYQDRQSRFDFDMLLAAFSLGATPTPESLELFYGSASREVAGSYNFPGMGDPAVDALIEAVGKARNRAELVTVMRCLDRVLRARLDWIPNINGGVRRLAFWNVFGFREAKPDYGFPVESLWWYDEAKAKAAGRA